MKQYFYVIVNNAGHSWPVLTNLDAGAVGDPNTSILAQLLKEGWEPVRETPMGGGTSQLAHSLILHPGPPVIICTKRPTLLPKCFAKITRLAKID